MTEQASARHSRITFSHSAGFHSILRKRVNEYFETRKIRKTGDKRLFVKTALIAAGVVASYTFLVFFASSWIGALIGIFLMAQSLALVGLNIQHDGNHGSYSERKGINWITGFSMDLIGASHFLWKQKHNILHHTYTNIDDLDDDLHTSGVLRLSPDQEWRPWHRFQVWYALPIYSMLTLSWILYADFRKMITGRIGEFTISAPKLKDVLLFVFSKGIYLSMALVVPLLYHSFPVVASSFVAVHLILGFTLAVVFQLAHTVEGNKFPTPKPDSLKIEQEWAIHEVETTADFARQNRLVTWYLGGLNFQIEHHLFPRISHVHYPEISRIVERTCREFGISYLAFPTVTSAVRAHLRHLRQMSAGPSL